MCALLERAEQPVGILDAASRVAKPHYYTLLFGASSHRKLTPCLPQHSSLAILGEIQKDLHQTLPVRPNGRQTRLDMPLHVDTLIAERRFDNDAQLFEY